MKRSYFIIQYIYYAKIYLLSDNSDDDKPRQKVLNLKVDIDEKKKLVDLLQHLQKEIRKCYQY